MAKDVSFERFELQEEHENDVFKVFAEKNIKEQLPEMFLQVSPFKPNKPGPKAKYMSETILQNSFGSVILNGYELTVFDEDIFLAIISTKKQIKDGDYYFITSFRELANLTGTTWRGAKYDENGKLKGNSTPKQILDSIHRLWTTGININVEKTKESHNIRLIGYYSNPFIDENKKTYYQPGANAQIKIRISKEFLYLYHSYKKFTLKLEDRIKINNLIGKALHRYLTYLTTFKKKGIHSERLYKIIEKINWKLPLKGKNSSYIDWRETKRVLEAAKKGLKNVGIELEVPEDTLNHDSILVFKNNNYLELPMKIEPEEID